MKVSKSLGRHGPPTYPVLGKLFNLGYSKVAISLISSKLISFSSAILLKTFTSENSAFLYAFENNFVKTAFSKDVLIIFTSSVSKNSLNIFLSIGLSVPII